jgi:hypothetical protein
MTLGPLALHAPCVANPLRHLVNGHSLGGNSACKSTCMGAEVLLMVVVAFACAVIGCGALHFAAKLPEPRLGGKSEWR